MKAIWKYPLGLFAGRQTVYAPESAFPLHVAMQGDALHVWMMVETNESQVPHEFVVIGTGQELPLGDHIGTVLEGAFVWHVFEVSV